MSQIKLDHIFVLTEPGAEIATRLIEIGMVEGEPRVHPGQGTSNRQFHFAGFALELLYVRDASEALQGPGRELRVSDRFRLSEASPFGIIVRVENPAANPGFSHWQYYPDYFNQEMCFYIGENSTNLQEPLCICMPPELPHRDITHEQGNPGWVFTGASIGVAIDSPSEVLNCFSEMDKLQINYGQTDSLTVCFNHGSQGKSLDLQPHLPLLVEW